MGFIDDENLEAIAGRREHGPFAQLARIVDTPVARRVDLDHIERTTPVAAEFDAARAGATWGVGRPLSAVEAARKNAGRGGLAAAAGAAKQIGMPDATSAQRGHQRLGHMSLTDHLGKSLWPVTAIQCGSHALMLLGTPDKLPGKPELRQERQPKPNNTRHRER